MAKRARGQGTVYKEEDPARRTKWRAEITVDLPNGSVQRVSARGMTQQQAVSRMLDRAARARHANPDAQHMSVEHLMGLYRAHRLPEWRVSTAMEFDRVAARAVERIGGVTLVDVTPAVIEAAMLPDRQAGLVRTANGVRRELMAAFRFAVARELLDRNPVDAVPAIRQVTSHRRVWQPDEIRRFLLAARRVLGPVSFAAIHTALFTGLRQGEIIALRWADVTPEGVRVRATMSKGGLTPGKTGAALRVVPINERVFEVIFNARAGSDSVWALPTASGRPLSARNLGRALHSGVRATMERDAAGELVEGTGVPVLTFHDLRGVAATLWAASGVSPKVIQKLLGHSTPRLALEVYTSVMEYQMVGVALDPVSLRSGGSIGGSGVSLDARIGTDGPAGDVVANRVPDVS